MTPTGRSHRHGRIVAALMGGGLMFLAGCSVIAQAAITGDAERGRGLYQVCSGCHSVDEDDVGPRHRGVVGRKAGSVPGYAYSAALKNAQLQWTSENLDRWLANPQGLVPGTKMFFAMPNAQDRADVIAFLSQQR
jgi:cytochrome c